MKHDSKQLETRFWLETFRIIADFAAIGTIIIAVLVVLIAKTKDGSDRFTWYAHVVLVLLMGFVALILVWKNRPRAKIWKVPFNGAVLLIDTNRGYYGYGPGIPRLNSNALVRIRTLRALLTSLVDQTSATSRKSEILREAGRAVGSDFAPALLTSENPRPGRDDIRDVLKSWISLDRNTAFADIMTSELEDFEFGRAMEFYIGDTFFHERHNDATGDRFCDFFAGYIEAVLRRSANHLDEEADVTVKCKCPSDGPHLRCHYTATLTIRPHENLLNGDSDGNPDGHVKSGSRGGRL